MSCHSLVACRVCTAKAADGLMEVPLYGASCFSLAASKILTLIFAILIIICFGVDLFGIICLGLSSLTGLGYLFPFSG